MVSQKAKPHALAQTPQKDQVVIYDEYMISRKVILRYMLMCTPDFQVFSADEGCDVFSALILLCDDGVVCESKFIYDITRSESAAHRIMKLLSEAGVTPAAADDIISEIL